MAESKLGEKHLCFSCGAKFYDFGRPKKICPRCGVDQNESESEKEAEEVKKVKKAKKVVKAKS